MKKIVLGTSSLSEVIMNQNSSYLSTKVLLIDVYQVVHLLGLRVDVVHEGGMFLYVVNGTTFIGYCHAQI